MKYNYSGTSTPFKWRHFMADIILLYLNKKFYFRLIGEMKVDTYESN